MAVKKKQHSHLSFWLLFFDPDIFSLNAAVLFCLSAAFTGCKAKLAFCALQFGHGFYLMPEWSGTRLAAADVCRSAVIII